MASESALTATETLWKPPAPMSSRSIFLLQEFALSGDAQYALSGVGGGDGVASAYQDFPSICSMALMRWEMAEGLTRRISAAASKVPYSMTVAKVVSWSVLKRVIRISYAV